MFKKKMQGNKTAVFNDVFKIYIASDVPYYKCSTITAFIKRL